MAVRKKGNGKPVTHADLVRLGFDWDEHPMFAVVDGMVTERYPQKRAVKLSVLDAAARDARRRRRAATTARSR